MANIKGPSNFRNMMYNGKHSLLPPKSPFPITSPSYLDYVSSPTIEGKGIPKSREGNPHHQRTSSESTLIEDQPSWLDELLNEPETPVRKGHRRSSSDSFAYMDVANAAKIDYAAQDEYRSINMASVPSRSCQEFDYRKDAQHASLYPDVNPLGKIKNRAWNLPSNALAHSNGLLSGKDNFVLQNSASSFGFRETDRFPSNTTDKQNPVKCDPYDTKASSERKDSSFANASASETDTKRAKQQFAQRSRVRKLQYIAELERNVQALQAEGSEVSAELKFLNQQNLILSMENKALKQRLETIAQVQVIKHLEHEVLERERGRLRTLHQQQPQPPQQLPSSRHRCTNIRETNSTDLQSQFASLSLKQESSSSICDAVSGQLHI